MTETTTQADDPMPLAEDGLTDLLVQLLKRGVNHPNRFGVDPASRGDYLAVNIAE